MKNFVLQNRFFLILYLVFLIAGGAVLVLTRKGDETLFFNSLHRHWADVFFVYATRLAEWPLFLIIILVTFFSNYGKGLLLIINYLLVGAAVQALKLMIFENEMRPSVFFEGAVNLNFVDGMEILRVHSFPSGHTACGFAVFFMLSIFYNNKKLSAFFFLCALMIGISRIYLMEHFLSDVYFGSIIAVVISTVFYITFAQSKWFNGLSWKDKALFER